MADDRILKGLLGISGGGILGTTMAQTAPNTPPVVIPMPQTVFDALAAARKNNFIDASNPIRDGQIPDAFTHPAIQGYENLIDNFLAARNLQPGDRFRVNHPEGPRFYEVLPPSPDYRKFWRQLPDPFPPLTS